MYDLTRLESFNDVRIWIEGEECFALPRLQMKGNPSFSRTVSELRKNCDPDLLIYIVGSKSDLSDKRQVTPDRVRTTLHKWFPPPRRPDPEIRPATPTSVSQGINAYLRPRFTSLASAYTVNSGSSAGSGIKVGLTRANTTASPQSPRKDGARFNSFQSFDALPTLAGPQRILARTNQQQQQLTHHRERSWGPSGSVPSVSFPSILYNGNKEIPSEAVSDEEEDEPEWGLGKYMQLFEVSAKDASGVY
jgi:hypothetical protein